MMEQTKNKKKLKMFVVCSKQQHVVNIKKCSYFLELLKLLELHQSQHEIWKLVILFYRKILTALNLSKQNFNLFAFLYNTSQSLKKILVVFLVFFSVFISF